MRRRTLAPHLEREELERRYRQATDSVARSQRQILWLLAQGQSTDQIVSSTGYSKNWICTVVQRYNTDGPDGVGDRWHTNPGAVALLSDAQLAETAGISMDMLSNSERGVNAPALGAGGQSEYADPPLHDHAAAVDIGRITVDHRGDCATQQARRHGRGVASVGAAGWRTSATQASCSDRHTSSAWARLS